MTRKTVTVKDFLTDKQIKRAMAMYQDGQGNFASRFATEVIEPNLKTINEKLGQENDARFLAYAVEYALMQSSR